MVLMEDSVVMDRTAWRVVDKERGLGVGVLHLVDGSDHLWGDSKPLLGLG